MDCIALVLRNETINYEYFRFMSHDSQKKICIKSTLLNKISEHITRCRHDKNFYATNQKQGHSTRPPWVSINLVSPAGDRFKRKTRVTDFFYLNIFRYCSGDSYITIKTLRLLGCLVCFVFVFAVRNLKFISNWATSPDKLLSLKCFSCLYK